MKKIIFALVFCMSASLFAAEIAQPYQIFENNSDGYVLYRIPSIVALPSNRVVAFTEARGEGKTDCAENDLVCKISEDGGESWSDMVLIAAAGAASLNNPTTVYLPESERILMMYQSYPPASFEATVAKGVDSERTCRVWTLYSDDGGYSWSTPVDVTAQTKTVNMSAVASGPGAMIQIDRGPFAGRIVVPFASTGLHDAGWFNYLVYSDDNGLTWKMSETFSGYGTNESQVVQIADDKLLVTVRNHRYKKSGEKKPVGWNPWAVSRTAEDRGEYIVTMTESGFEWSNLSWRK
ncbi:MAG: exo-alpha-sialidase, partial [Spirochaetales bacterium]|nr:exo-alpha-sialidase [Spirochaetales bacterium]